MNQICGTKSVLLSQVHDFRQGSYFLQTECLLTPTLWQASWIALKCKEMIIKRIITYNLLFSMFNGLIPKYIKKRDFYLS
jgi:hypothetical protein